MCIRIRSQTHGKYATLFIYANRCRMAGLSIRPSLPPFTYIFGLYARRTVVLVFEVLIIERWTWLPSVISIKWLFCLLKADKDTPDPHLFGDFYIWTSIKHSRTVRWTKIKQCTFYYACFWLWWVFVFYWAWLGAAPRECIVKREDLLRWTWSC